MTASVAQASPGTPHSQETSTQRNERIFHSLPPLGSAAYLNLLKTAPATALPAPVLVRAYRQLKRDAAAAAAANATLERLLGYNERYGYLTVMYETAHRRRTRLGGFGVNDLIRDTINEVFATLEGARGEIAERAWVQYLLHCMEDAQRKLIGRRGQRVDDYVKAMPDAARGNDDEGEWRDPIEAWDGGAIPWHGRAGADHLEWLEGFIERTFSEIEDEQTRAVALDMFSHTPTQVSSKDPHDPNTLAGQFGVDRFAIYQCKRAARATLYAALERQNEREIDMSFLSLAN